MILFRYDAKGALAAAADFSNGIHIQVTALEPVMRSRSRAFFWSRAGADFSNFAFLQPLIRLSGLLKKNCCDGAGQKPEPTEK